MNYLLLILTLISCFAYGSEESNLDIKILKQLRCYASVTSVAYCPDHADLLALGLGENIIILDLKTDQAVTELRGHTKWVRSIAWDHHSNRLASASADKSIRIWNTETGECIKQLDGHSDQVRQVAWDHHSGRLASGSDDGTVRIWDLTTGQSVMELHGHTTWPLLPGFITNMLSVAYNPDNTNQVTSGSSDGAVEIWDLHTGKSVMELRDKYLSGSVQSIAYNPNNPQEITASGSALHCRVRTWNLKDPRVPKRLFGHRELVPEVAYVVCNGTYKPISGSADGTVMIWDPETPNLPLFELCGHTGWVHSVDCDPHNSNRFVSGSDDQTVIVWSIGHNESDFE